MATLGGPHIIEDGLVFAIDAANRKSYTSGSSTWVDLVGGNNGVLTNGPTFDSGDGGSIVFDGTNDYVEVIDFLPNNTSFTLSFWLNYSNQNLSTTGIISTWDNNWNGWGLANFQGSLRSWIRDGAAGGMSWVSLSNIYNQWNLVTLIYQHSSGQSFYLNTTYYGFNSIIANVSPSNLQIGRGGQTGTPQLSGYTYSNCKISNLLIYNKIFTSQEVSQNYNALKGRFGLT
jgi:hypothetical protein